MSNWFVLKTFQTTQTAFEGTMDGETVLSSGTGSDSSIFRVVVRVLVSEGLIGGKLTGTLPHLVERSRVLQKGIGIRSNVFGRV